MKVAAVLVCVLLLLPVRAAVSGGNPEQSEWSGAFSPYQNFSAQVIRDANSWSQIWAQLGQPPPQSFDAALHLAIAVFLGSRRTGGYDLAIDPAGQTDMAQLFRVRELAPAPDAFVPQVLTTPYRIFLLPMNAQPVLFLTGFNGAASGECLYIPSGERRRAESITQFLNKPICPEAPGQSSEGS